MQKPLEKLIVNNPSLSKVRSHVAHFNPIKVMGMEQMEIRHSNILGWLLNPRENHGLGDEFLKAFLCQAMLGETAMINSLTINNRNLADANVYIEWNHIDLFIEVPDINEPWCFIIENKIRSTQSTNQLAKYRDKIEERYSTYKKGYIYLTLNDEEPADENYSHIRYEQVVEIINNLLDQVKDTVSTRIFNFIKYYLEIISELCDMNGKSEDMKVLARQIYQDNKKALDFIFEHGMSNEFDYAVTQFLGDENARMISGDLFAINEIQYEFVSRNQREFHFIPRNWANIFNAINSSEDNHITEPWPGCEKWRSHGLPMVMWLDFIERKNKNGTNFSIRLTVELGPISDSELRLQLVTALSEEFKTTKSTRLKFQSLAYQDGAMYSKCLSIKDNLKDPQDSTEITALLEKHISKFEKDYVSIIERGISNFANIKASTTDTA